MVVNTHPLNPALDREDEGAIASSVSQQWIRISHLLGLPSLHALQNDNAEAQLVGQRIADHIVRVRGNLGDRDGIRDLLLENYERERDMALAATVDPSIPHATTRHPNIALAEAWLKTIYSNLSESDIRGMIDQLPAAIRPVDGSRNWRASNINTAIPPAIELKEIFINLDSGHWRSGTRQQITQRIVGLTPAQADIIYDPPVPPIATITPEIADQIFASQYECVDMQVANREVILLHVPRRDERVVIDLPGLIRNDPNIAAMDEPALQTHFTIFPDIYSRFVTTIQADGSTTTPPAPARIVGPMFAQLQRNAAQALCAQTMSLDAALTQRAPMERLLASTTDNRELLLALATIQRDPSAANVLTMSNASYENVNRRRRVAEAVEMMRGWTPITLPAQLRAESTFQQIRNARGQLGIHINTLEAAEQYWATADAHYQAQKAAYDLDLNQWQSEKDEFDRQQSAWNQYNVAVASARSSAAALTPPAFAVPAPIRSRPVFTQRPAQFAPLTLLAPYAATVGSVEEARNRITEYRNLYDQMNAVLQEIQTREDAILEVYEALQQMNITNFPAVFPRLNALVTPGTPPTINGAALTANMSYAPLAKEIQNTIPDGLKSAADYEEDLKAEREKLKPMEGSDACWAVIRRGLENQGLRGEELDHTVQYMQSQVERRPESVRDLEQLMESALPYSGDPNDVAEQRYNEGKTFRHRFRRVNPYRHTLNRLFTEGNIGLTLNADPRQRQYPVSRLIHAYFRTKYLMSLPPENPLHLPESQEIVGFLRRLHMAILDRMQLSFRRSAAISNRAMRELRAAGMEIQESDVPKMSATERMEALQNYLVTGGGYYDQYKGTIEKIAERVNRPLREAKTRHDGRAARRKRDLARPFQFLGKAGATGGNWLIGNGAPYNPATWPGKTVRGTWNNKGSIALGAAAGIFIPPWPLGVLVGMAGGPIVKKIYQSQKGTPST